jgi:hypothetical protein
MSPNEVVVVLDDTIRLRRMNKNAHDEHHRGSGINEWEMMRTSVYFGAAHLPTADAADVTNNRRTMMIGIIGFMTVPLLVDINDALSVHRHKGLGAKQSDVFKLAPILLATREES